MTTAEFQKVVASQGSALFRPMPWRSAEETGQFSPYKILVSECMLQQTQVSRVIPKFQEFMQRFPTITVLARAELADVIRAWSGLGYNRRAMYLHEAAQKLPPNARWSYEDLVNCRGIGPNTARAVLVYAYNDPQVFVETNLRTVIIHYFFPDDAVVGDEQIREIVTETLDHHDPRRWYWALMDMGAAIKATHGNAARRSLGYKKQSPFKGSLRQLRGQILKLLGETPLSLQELKVKAADERVTIALDSLIADGMVHEKEGLLHLGRQ